MKVRKMTPRIVRCHRSKGTEHGHHVDRGFCMFVLTFGTKNTPGPGNSTTSNNDGGEKLKVQSIMKKKK